MSKPPTQPLDAMVIGDESSDAIKSDLRNLGYDPFRTNVELGLIAAKYRNQLRAVLVDFRPFTTAQYSQLNHVLQEASQRLGQAGVPIVIIGGPPNIGLTGINFKELSAGYTREQLIAALGVTPPPR